MAEAEDKVRSHEEHCNHESRKHIQTIKELEKRLEVLKISADERLNFALEGKDKEIGRS